MHRLILAASAALTLCAGVGCSAHAGAPASPQVALAAPVQPEPSGPAPFAPAPSTPASSTPGTPAHTDDAMVVSGPVTMEQQLDVVVLRAGVVESLDADVDSAVRKGQVLARLDDRQLASDRNTALYKANGLQADLKNWEAEVQVREADLRRAEAMRKEGITTQESYDHAKYNLTASQYEVERQRQEMLSAQAGVKSLDLELEKTRICAPFTGVVSQRYVRLGQFVNAGDKLFRVTGTSPLEVRFTLRAEKSMGLKRGDRVTVAATPEFERSTPAAVTHISPVVDPGSGTVEVTAVLTQKLPGLLPGMVASIRVPKAR